MKMAELGGTVSQEFADLVTFTEEILNGKLHFLCSVCMEVTVTFTEFIFIANYRNVDKNEYIAIGHVYNLLQYILRKIKKSSEFRKTLISFYVFL